MELKPCPFCGEPATQIYNLENNSYKYGCCTIRCMGNALRRVMDFNTDAEAIEAWNRRADNV